MTPIEIYAMLQRKINEGGYGSPLVASTAAGMTDHDRVYVYTGSETGYTAGNWYYWNGTAWTSGGVYNAVAVETDKTLAVENKAADGAATGAAIEELKEELTQKANSDGSYENMKVGLAENLDPTVFIEDVAAYTFRTSGGNNDIGDFEKLSEITGGSLVWNQLVSDNVIHGTIASGTSATDLQSLQLKANHKYLYNLNLSRQSTGGFENSDYQIVLRFFGGAPAIYHFDLPSRPKVVMVDSTQYSSLTSYTYADTFGGDVTYALNVFDLTAMFGPTIADYIYSLEQATAGAGVAWFRRYFPNDYYAYCEPHFEHVQVEAHETVGFNQCDEVWEDGTIDIDTGLEQSSTTHRRLKNAIPVVNATYCIKSNGGAGIRCFSANGKYLGNIAKSSAAADVVMTFTPLSGTAYIRVVMPKADAELPCCINLSWDGSRDGEYEPYDKRSYPLDDVVLRGIPKIDASGNLYFEGDEYTSDGTVTRKYGIVDLGTLSWAWNNSASTGQYYAVLNNAVSKSVNALLATSKYLISENGAYSGVDKRISFRTNIIWLTDSDIGNSAADSLKTSLDGVYLVYELATPTTEEAAPYLETQWCNDFGTERFVPASSLTRDVEVPVGHVTKYPPDLKAKVEMSPNSPPSNGLWLVKHENGENTYVQYLGELPADPTEDGSYYLKATRSSGTTTLSWEAQE